MEEGAKLFNNMLDEKVSGNKLMKITGSPDLPRAHYSITASAININSKSDGARVVLHEAGHWLEHKNPSVGKKANDFLIARTKNEKAVSMASATNNVNYRSDEKTKLDKFISPNDLQHPKCHPLQTSQTNPFFDQKQHLLDY